MNLVNFFCKLKLISIYTYNILDLDLSKWKDCELYIRPTMAHGLNQGWDYPSKKGKQLKLHKRRQNSTYFGIFRTCGYYLKKKAETTFNCTFNIQTFFDFEPMLQFSDNEIWPNRPNVKFSFLSTDASVIRFTTLQRCKQQFNKCKLTFWLWCNFATFILSLNIIFVCGLTVRSSQSESFFVSSRNSWFLQLDDLWHDQSDTLRYGFNVWGTCQKQHGAIHMEVRPGGFGQVNRASTGIPACNIISWSIVIDCNVFA